MADDAEKLATEVATQTAQLLKSQGWCLWRCTALKGDVITVVNDPPNLSEQDEKTLMDQLVRIYEREPDKTKVNQEWMGTVYTTTELRQFAEVDEGNMTLIHEAKKLGGTLSPKEEP